MRAIQIHRVDIQIPVTHRCPDNRLAVGSDRGLRVISRRIRQSLRVQAIDSNGEQIVVVQGPPVGASLPLGLRGTIRAPQMSGRVQDAPIAGKEIAAGGRAGTGADHPDLFAGEIHHIHLITAERDIGRMHRRGKRILHPIVGRLEDEFVAAERKIGLGILPTKRELPDIRQVPLARSRQRHRRRGRL